VDIALRNIMATPPDLVVTGINRGYNLGLSIYVSERMAPRARQPSAGIRDRDVA
jgi:broad specificity polyphosphatase/5'/3'-nucleotidase SurE